MPRAGLTRERVVAEAARLADEVGYERLTAAAVAARFGVRLPSLYKHVDGLDALRRFVTLLALRELGDELRRAAVGRSGSVALRALAHRYRDYAHRHPGRYAATLHSPDPSDEALSAAAEAILEVVFAVLSGYGLSGADLVDATRVLRSGLHGFVSLEAAGGFGMPQDVDRSFELLVTALDTAFEDWNASAAARSRPRVAAATQRRKPRRRPSLS